MPIGFSDHTKDQFASALAAGLGCKIFEKHFTLDKTLKGPDHKASLDISELQDFIYNLKNFHKAFGINNKKCLNVEKQARFATRQSLHARSVIKKGEPFTLKNTILRRPADGIQPKDYRKILNRKSKKSYKVDQPIKF